MSLAARITAFAALATITGSAALACSAGEVHVGTMNQELKKKQDGGATGDGKTCSWDDTVSSDSATGKTTPPSADSYAVGQSFPSPDGCNTCTCTPEGITCTLKECGGGGGGGGGGGRACKEDAKECPNGIYVGRIGPNCEFPPCP